VGERFFFSILFFVIHSRRQPLTPPGRLPGESARRGRLGENPPRSPEEPPESASQQAISIRDIGT